MALRMGNAPAGCREAAAQAVRDIARLKKQESAYAGIAGVNVSALSLSQPLQVYTIELTCFRQENCVKQAAPGNWKYFVISNGQIIESVEVIYDVQSGKSSFSHTRRGRFEQSALDAIQVAEHLDGVIQGSYEMRWLRVAAIYVVCVWLKDEQGDQDWIVPVDPVSHGLIANQAYSVGDFCSALRASAAIGHSR